MSRTKKLLGSLFFFEILVFAGSLLCMFSAEAAYGPVLLTRGEAMWGQATPNWDCVNKCTLPVNEKESGCYALDKPVDCAANSNGNICGFKVHKRFTSYNCAANPSGTGSLANCAADTAQASCYVQSNCLCIKIEAKFIIGGGPALDFCYSPVLREAITKRVIEKDRKVIEKILEALHLEIKDTPSAAQGCALDCKLNKPDECKKK